jgi:hypothetical protein
MKRVILVSILALAALVAFAPVSNAEMAKEGTASGTMIFSGTFKALPMGQERLQMAFEVLGAYVGEGPLNHSSFRCVGGMHAVKGEFLDETGSCIFTNPDGDQAWSTYKCAGQVGRSARGTFKWVGGTGKLTGMQGEGKFERYNVRPAAEGTIQGYAQTKGSWKLP